LAIRILLPGLQTVFSFDRITPSIGEEDHHRAHAHRQFNQACASINRLFLPPSAIVVWPQLAGMWASAQATAKPNTRHYCAPSRQQRLQFSGARDTIFFFFIFFI
jgi:hypothetical protein